MSKNTERFLGKLAQKDAEKEKTGNNMADAAAPFLGETPSERTDEQNHEGSKVLTFEGTKEGSNVPTNEGSKEQTKERTNDDLNEGTKVRKRYSFDLMPSIHKAMKTQALIEDRNLYELAEEAFVAYLREKGRIE